MSSVLQHPREALALPVPVPLRILVLVAGEEVPM